jgi:hypothetical protein
MVFERNVFISYLKVEQRVGLCEDLGREAKEQQLRLPHL